jgi:UDP:flavonoid glycosyltransferase YjiC (YdhE family)
MIPLALALRDRGHDVRWVTGPDACERLESLGIAAVPPAFPGRLTGRVLEARPEVGSMPPGAVSGPHVSEALR